MKIFAAIFILFFGYNLVSACSCRAITEELKDKALRDSPFVFEGKVIATDKSWFNPSDDVDVEFQVLRAWKGVEKNEINIKTPSDSAACGYSFKKNSTYFVYAHGNPPRTITCTMMLVDEARIRQTLGEGKAFENLPQEEGFFAWLWRKITSIFS